MKIGGKEFFFIGLAESECEAEGIACTWRKNGHEVRIKKRRTKHPVWPVEFKLYARELKRGERFATITINEDQARVILHGTRTLEVAELDSPVASKEIEAIIVAAFPRLRKMKGDRV